MKSNIRSDKVRLQHIRDALIKIEQFSAAELRDDKSASAVLYQLTIIGEAVRILSDGLKSSYPEVPWQDISGMRNRLVHEYFDVDYQVLWDTVIQDVPRLKTWVDAILRQVAAASDKG